MRPNTLGSLRWIAAVLLLSGCYRPWMQPGAGYGGPMYGNQYYQGGYGGYPGSQGIQTLTPGNYYDPNTGGTPTYSQPNGLVPQADPGISGGGSGNGAGDGGNAPLSPYNPQGVDAPVKPVPGGNFYEDTPASSDPGGQMEPPESERPVELKKLESEEPSAMTEPAAAEEWAAEPLSDRPIEQVNREEEEKQVEPTEEEVPLLTPLTAP